MKTYKIAQVQNAKSVELRQMAAHFGIKGASKMKTEDLRPLVLAQIPAEVEKPVQVIDIKVLVEKYGTTGREVATLKNEGISFKVESENGRKVNLFAFRKVRVDSKGETRGMLVLSGKKAEDVKLPEGYQLASRPGKTPAVRSVTPAEAIKILSANGIKK